MRAGWVRRGYWGWVASHTEGCPSDFVSSGFCNKIPHTVPQTTDIHVSRSDGWTPEIKVPAWLGSRSIDGVFLVCSHMEGVRGLLGSLYADAHFITRAPPS